MYICLLTFLDYVIAYNSNVNRHPPFHNFGEYVLRILYMYEGNITGIV